MPVTALTSTSRDLLVGQVWPLAILVLDADLRLAAASTVLSVTLPDGTAVDPGDLPDVDTEAAGVYRYDYTATVPGRHLATVTAGDYGLESWVAFVTVPTPNTGLPTVDDVDNYLKSGSGEHSWTTDDLADALAAEETAQRLVCRVGAVYPPDLREALLRRVQRNLAMRPNALAMFRGDSDAGEPQAFLPGQDPEVRRWERPYRKLPIG